MARKTLEEKLDAIAEKESALKKKRKELEKEKRKKEKARLAKEKAEAEAKKAKTNAIIAELTRIWVACRNDEELISQLAKSIRNKYPALTEKVNEIVAGKIDEFEED